MSEVVQPPMTQKKLEIQVRRYETIIRSLTVVVAAAGGYIMLPKIFLPAEDSTKLSAIIVGIVGLILGCVSGFLSYRKKTQ